MLQYATDWQLVVLVTYVLLLFIFPLYRYLKMRHGYEMRVRWEPRASQWVEWGDMLVMNLMFFPYANIFALLYFFAHIAQLLVARPSQEARRAMDNVLLLLRHITSAEHLEELHGQFQHLETMYIFHRVRFDSRRRLLLGLYEEAYHAEDEDRKQRLQSELLAQLRQLYELARKFELACSDCVAAFAEWEQCGFSEAGREKARSCTKLALKQLAIACASTAEQST